MHYNIETRTRLHKHKRITVRRGAENRDGIYYRNCQRKTHNNGYQKLSSYSRVHSFNLLGNETNYAYSWLTRCINIKPMLDRLLKSNGIILAFFV
jgi:hypothetical protein